MVSEAIRDGNPQALNYFVAQDYVKAISGFATSPNAKTILFPVEATQLIGTIGGIGELAREALGGHADAATAKEKPSQIVASPFAACCWSWRKCWCRASICCSSAPPPC